MDSTTMMNDLNNILKEGFLQKESRFIKNWRKRWVVLTSKTLYTFKQQKSYSSPTEVIDLKIITSIKSCEQQTHRQNTFRIDVQDRSFYFGSANNIQNNNGLVKLVKQW